MVRVGKGLNAPSASTDLRGLSGRRHVSQCLHVLERMQVTNVPVRDPNSSGVQGPPKLSMRIKMWNVETSSLRPVQYRAGITARRAVGEAGLRG
jgi:hypothetical protein